MPQKINLTGKRFGRWVAIEETRVIGKNRPYYICMCDCGQKRVVLGLLSKGQSQSCGCWKKEKLSDRTKKHGLSRVNGTIYKAWGSLVSRCERAGHPQFSSYGGRGISVCEEWRSSFPAFYQWAIANGWKKGLSIDRINNDGNYEPSNCRWATDAQQQRNRKVSKTYDFFGEKWHLGEIAEAFGLDIIRITDRIYKGWNIYDAVFGKKRKTIWD